MYSCIVLSLLLQQNLTSNCVNSRLSNQSYKNTKDRQNEDQCCNIITCTCMVIIYCIHREMHNHVRTYIHICLYTNHSTHTQMHWIIAHWSPVLLCGFSYQAYSSPAPAALSPMKPPGGCEWHTVHICTCKYEMICGVHMCMHSHCGILYTNMCIVLYKLHKCTLHCTCTCICEYHTSIYKYTKCTNKLTWATLCSLKHSTLSSHNNYTCTFQTPHNKETIHACIISSLLWSKTWHVHMYVLS